MNARNQVATLNSVSLQYDAFGRRIQNASGKTILYDGANAAQELSGSTVLANLLSGGIDEVFTRADSEGAITQLTDDLGSTIALVDASGNVPTTYSYDPFGNTMASGAANGNAFQYTGRENEGNGLYFYRARYYAPSLARFASEDPLGFGGGLNTYMYASDDPIGLRDPLGLYDGWDFLRDFGTFSEAFTDTLTFGSASKLNDAFGANVAVNRCGWLHTAGTVAGIGTSIVVGGAIGAEFAEGNAGREGYEFSHWLPKRLGGPRSIWNGNFVSQKLHYLTDFSRFPAPLEPLYAGDRNCPPWLNSFLGFPGFMTGPLLVRQLAQQAH